MKRIFITIALCTWSSILFGQTLDLGVGINKVIMEGFIITASSDPMIAPDTSRDFRDDIQIFSAHVSASVPLYRLNNNASLNLQGTLDLGAAPSTFTLTAPAYLTFKYGPDASPDSDVYFGAALGIGVSYLGVLNDRLNRGGFMPQAMLELNNVLGDSRLYKLSFFVNLDSQIYKTAKSGSNVDFRGDVIITQRFGFRLGYSLTY